MGWGMKGTFESGILSHAIGIEDRFELEIFIRPRNLFLVDMVISVPSDREFGSRDSRRGA
jgi:hypothetical protein